MSIRAALIAMVIRHEVGNEENFARAAFWDRYQWSIGFGSVGAEGEEIDLPNARARLFAEISKANAMTIDLEEKICPTVVFSRARHDALVDMVYNIGKGGLHEFHRMWIAMQEGDWKRAAKEILDSAYAVQVGERAREIAAMIEWGVYVSPVEAEIFWRETTPILPPHVSTACSR